MKRLRLLPVFLILAALCVYAISASLEDQKVPTADAGMVDQAYVELVQVTDVDPKTETQVLDAEPAVSTVLTPEAPGTLVKQNQKAAIDYSNTADGYVMIKYIAQTSKQIKTQVIGPSGTAYTYNLTAGAADYTPFVLSDGNGSYKVTVYENVSGNSYASVLSATFQVTLIDEMAPFLYPNQYVNFTADSQTVAMARELTAGETEALDKVKAVYDYVVNNFSYDYDKAASVKSGYLPVLDTVLAEKKGICFDYAALMTGMLRSQGVPTKLVVGYTDTLYHAWINVYSEETGWVDGVIFFDGVNWKRMDPTFASTAKQSASIMQYISDDANYTAKYLY